MLAKISVKPQVGRDIRREIVVALEESERAGLTHEVDAFATAVVGDLEQILSAVRSVHARLAAEAVERFELHVRLRHEPGAAQLEHETAGFRDRAASVAAPAPTTAPRRHSGVVGSRRVFAAMRVTSTASSIVASEVHFF